MARIDELPVVVGGVKPMVMPAGAVTTENATPPAKAVRATLRTAFVLDPLDTNVADGARLKVKSGGGVTVS
jgi:hypothetical protein